MDHTFPSVAELSMLEEGMLPIVRRPRRNRATSSWRALVQETDLLPRHLIYPVFVTDEKKKQAIPSLRGVYRLPIAAVLKEIDEAISLGITSVNLFCYVPKEEKDAIGSAAYREDGLLPRAIRAIKERFPDVLLIADIALDPFTDHGFDGLIDAAGGVMNDPTLFALAHMSLRAAEAGVDLISPSDMMDGRIAFLRSILDSHHFSHVGILSYAVKFASSLYAPFRDLLGSTVRKGNKKSFQVNPLNAREALLECAIDEQEAADMILIKPALSSLDIISRARAHTLLPIGAYQVSGEYAMIEAAAEKGWLDGEKVLMESLHAIRRAGADFIITYAAKRAARLLQE